MRRKTLSRLAAAAVLAALPVLGVASPAEAVSCPAGDSCFWSGVSYGGTRTALPNSGSHGFWFALCPPVACPVRSVYEAGNSALWLYEASTGANECLLNGQTDLDTGGRYGYAYIEYGKTRCGTIPGGRP
jgi:hypothetical protein